MPFAIISAILIVAFFVIPVHTLGLLTSVFLAITTWVFIISCITTAVSWVFHSILLTAVLATALVTYTAVKEYRG